MENPHSAGYTEETTKGFAGTSGNELECTLEGTEIILYDIAVFIPSSSEAGTYRAGTVTSGTDIINNAYYNANSMASYFNYAGKGRRMTLPAAKKIFVKISDSQNFKVNIHYSYKP